MNIDDNNNKLIFKTKKRTCVCGSIISYSYFNSHLKTHKHKILLKEIETKQKKNDLSSMTLKFD
jgi:hypothetical protein